MRFYSLKRSIVKWLLAIMMVAILPLRSVGQTPYSQYADNGIMLNFFEIDDFHFRLYLLHQLELDDRFSLIPEEENGLFVVNPSEEHFDGNFFEAFDSFFNHTQSDFKLFEKQDLADFAPHWKESVSPLYFTSITMDYALNRAMTDNGLCVFSDPFCTSEVIQFHASTNQNVESIPDAGCLESFLVNPSWFHMRIHDPGQFIIHMEGVDPSTGTQRDIDFCLWGPFTHPTNPCTSQLTGGKIIDCCWSTSYSEDAYLGYPENQHDHQLYHDNINYHVPQTGEYYILLITNWSEAPCVISFTKKPNSGPGTTDCSILPPTISNDGPYCVGETIRLFAETQAGATYTWTGPAGFNTHTQNPTRPNCTLAMAGTYTCTITIGNQSSSSTTEVVVYPQPTPALEKRLISPALQPPTPRDRPSTAIHGISVTGLMVMDQMFPTLTPSLALIK